MRTCVTTLAKVNAKKASFKHFFSHSLYLVSVNIDNAIDVEREQDVQEQNLITEHQIQKLEKYTTKKLQFK